jgi:hypothetical protein
VVVEEVSTIFLPRRERTEANHQHRGRIMDSSETAFASSINASELREYHARHVGRTKYAIVLSGERDEVAGWGYDEESAIKVAEALNLAERP